MHREEEESLYRRLRCIQDGFDREFNELFSHVPSTTSVREEKTDKWPE